MIINLLHHHVRNVDGGSVKKAELAPGRSIPCRFNKPIKSRFSSSTLCNAKQEERVTLCRSAFACVCTMQAGGHQNKYSAQARIWEMACKIRSCRPSTIVDTNEYIDGHKQPALASTQLLVKCHSCIFVIDESTRQLLESYHWPSCDVGCNMQDREIDCNCVPKRQLDPKWKGLLQLV